MKKVVVEPHRFSISLIAGIIIINIFYFLQIAFPNLTSWYIQVNWWGLSVWLLIGGFVTGLVVGLLVKDLRKGIAGGFTGAFLGPIIGGYIALFALYLGGYDSKGYDTPLWTMMVSFHSGLVACIPAIIGSVFGTLIMKEIIKRTVKAERN